MSKKNDNGLSIQVLRKFRVIYGSVRQHFRKIEQTCGVSGSQLWILQEVSTSPGIGVSDLANKLSIHQSTCSLLIEKLVIRGLITKERSLQDQRRVGLYLNEQTQEIIAKSPGPAEGILPQALMDLPEDVLKVLDESLAEVINHLRLADEKYAEEPLSDI